MESLSSSDSTLYLTSLTMQDPNSCTSSSFKMKLPVKAECIFSMVISSEFRMGQYRDDDHREDAVRLTHPTLLNGRKDIT